MTLPPKPLFITLEGGEGAGKSTAIKYLSQQLTSLSIPVRTTREPGGTPIAEQIRHLLLQTQTEQLTSMSELLLIFAGRSQHISEVIRPTLARGEWVICDRFTDATFAYQGGGRGMDAKTIQSLAQMVQGDLTPDYTILLDAPPTLGMQRIKRRAMLDRIETEQLAFFERVRTAYLARAKAEPARFVIINTAKPLPEVKRQLRRWLHSILGLSTTLHSTAP